MATPHGWRRTTSCGRSGSTTPTPTWCCRSCCASTGSAAATPASPPSSLAARCAGRGSYDAVSTPASTAARRCSPGCATCCGSAPTSCWRCGSPTTPRSARPSTWPGHAAGQRSAGLVNAVLRRIAAADLDDLARAGRARRRERPVGTPPSCTATRAGWSRRSPGTGGAAAELDALLAADNAPPRVVLVARPGRSDGRRAARRADPALAVRRGAGRRRPRRGPRGRRGARRRPGRGLAAGGPGAGRAPRSRARTGAGSTSAPAPAARRRCSPRWRPSGAPGWWPTSGSRTARGWSRARSPAPTGSSGVSPHDGTRPPWPAGYLRPGPGRRALLGPGGAPAPARGALATPPDDLAGAGAAAARAARRGRSTLVRPGGVVLYATCSPVLAETSDVLSAVLVGPRRRPARAGAARPARRRPRRWPGTAAAVAAPARHGRDVPGAAAPHVTEVTSVSVTTG